MLISTYFFSVLSLLIYFPPPPLLSLPFLLLLCLPSFSLKKTKQNNLGAVRTNLGNFRQKYWDKQNKQNKATNNNNNNTPETHEGCWGAVWGSLCSLLFLLLLFSFQGVLCNDSRENTPQLQWPQVAAALLCTQSLCVDTWLPTLAWSCRLQRQKPWFYCIWLSYVMHRYLQTLRVKLPISGSRAVERGTRNFSNSNSFAEQIS